MNRIVIIFLTIFLSGQLFSQKYNTLAGIRIGDDFGITGTQRIGNKATLNLIVQPGTFAGNEMMVITANKHYSLLTKRLNFFMGAGYYNRHSSYNNLPPLITDKPVSYHSKGLALTFGGEVTLGRLSVAADYVPLVNFGGNDDPRRFITSSGLSLRYVIVPQKSKKKKFFEKIFTKNDDKSKKKKSNKSSNSKKKSNKKSKKK